MSHFFPAAKSSVEKSFACKLLRVEEPNLCILPIGHEALGLQASLPIRSSYAAMAAHVRRLTGAVVVGCADAYDAETEVKLNPHDKEVEREWVEGDRLVVLSTLGERHGPQRLAGGHDQTKLTQL